jgi:hypothetical protein
MNFRFCLAAAAPLFLIPALWGAPAQIPEQQTSLIQVKHHRASPRRLPPRCCWITTPGVNAGISTRYYYYYYNYPSFGASPGQPGSPTYAPYAGLPPLRYHSN